MIVELFELALNVFRLEDDLLHVEALDVRLCLLVRLVFVHLLVESLARFCAHASRGLDGTDLASCR